MLDRKTIHLELGVWVMPVHKQVQGAGRHNRKNVAELVGAN